MKNFIKFLIFLLLLLSISLFIITYYKSELIFKGEKFEYFKSFYFISVVLFLISITLFFLNNIIRIYSLITVFSILIALYSFEIFLIYNEKKNEVNSFKEYRKINNKNYDTRSKYEVYNELKKTNIKISTYVPSIYFEKDKKNFITLSGISNSKIILCNENGYYSFYESDRYGFNNPDEVWNKQEIEYLLVGDSFTLGSCVNRPNDISSVLRTLSKKPVINLGYGGNGPLKEYASLKEYIPNNVKKVLWLYYEGNDLRDLWYEKNSSILMKYLKDPNFSQDLRGNQKILNDYKVQLVEKEINKTRNNQNYSFYKLKKFFKLHNFRKIYFNHIGQSTKSELADLKVILKKTKDFTLKKNIKLYFIYLPEFLRFKKNYSQENYYEVKKIVTNLDIPFIDINKLVFDKQKNKLELFPFEKFGHYNVKGYKYVAEAIYNFTKNY